MIHTRFLQIALFLLLAASNLFSQDEPEKYREDYKEDYREEYKTGWEAECSCQCEYCKTRHHDYGYKDDYFRIKAISSRDFNELTGVIASKSFETTKIAVIKTAMQDNYFNTDQVKSLLNMFSFESNKLELAKLAYSKTVDNNRYYKIYGAFAFESSISELEEYIKNQ